MCSPTPDWRRAPSPRGDEPAAERVRKIIAREIVVAEEESIYALAAYRAATTEPAIRAVFDLLLVDEVRHAAAGRALLELVGNDAQLRATMDADRADLRTRYSDSARGGPGRALGACIELADLMQIWTREVRSVRETSPTAPRSICCARAATPTTGD